MAGSLIAFVVIAVLATGGRSPSFAQSGGSGATGAGGPRAEAGAPIALPKLGAAIDPTNGPGRREARERAQARGEAKERERRSPEAKQQRKASRKAHTALKHDQALTLAKKTFPELVEQPAFAPFHLREGEHVSKWLSDYAVKIESGSGRPARLVESLIPVRSRDAAGMPIPVDYALTGNSDWYWPTAPLAKTLMAKNVKQGVQFPDIGVGVAAGAGEVDDVTAVETKDKLFYANAGTDVDHITTPIPGGVQLGLIVRSERSAERFSYDFKLPAGARLQRSTTRLGGIEIVKGDTPLALVSPPVAWDADQTPVPVSYEIAGDRLVIDVKHREGDFAMPIAVDPSITEDQRYWYFNPGIDKIGWEFYANNPSGFQGFSGTSYLGDGLYIYHRGTSGYGAGNFANWAFTAPGDSRITRAEFGYVVHEPQTYGNWPEPYNDDYITEGVFSRQYNQFEGGSWCEPDNTCGSTPFYAYQRLNYNYKSHFVAGTPGNVAIFNMTNYYAGDHTDFTGYLGSAALVIDDPNPPQVTEDYGLSDSSWTSYRNFQASGSDYGLGMKRLAVDSPGNPNWPGAYTYENPCTGDRRSRCPGSLNISDDTNGLPEGIAPVRYTATDVVGNTDARNWDLRIDRTPPDIRLSGGLYDRRGSVIGPGDRGLTVDATDGDNSSLSTTRSGVKSIEVLIDGNRAQNGYLEQPCSTQGNCAGHLAFTLDSAAYAEGSHTVQVIARDQLGHQRFAPPFDFVIDRTPPSLEVTGALAEQSDKKLSDGFWSMDVAAKDESTGRLTAGVRNIEVTVNGARLTVDGADRGFVDQDVDCSGTACPLDFLDVPYSTREYSAGAKTIVVRAEDYVGNVATRQFNIDNSNDVPEKEQQAMASSPRFNVYHLGPSLEGLILNDATRQHVATDPQFSELARQDNVTYLYGDCPATPAAGADVEGGCLPPIEVQSSPLCEKHKGLYQDSETGGWPSEALTIKGVPAAAFDQGRVLEIYTLDTTITIYGKDAAQVLRVADLLRLALPVDIPSLTAPLTTLSAAAGLGPALSVLPPPDQAVLAQTEPCK